MLDMLFVMWLIRGWGASLLLKHAQSLGYALLLTENKDCTLQWPFLYDCLKEVSHLSRLALCLYYLHKQFLTLLCVTHWPKICCNCKHWQEESCKIAAVDNTLACDAQLHASGCCRTAPPSHPVNPELPLWIPTNYMHNQVIHKASSTDQGDLLVFHTKIHVLTDECHSVHVKETNKYTKW